MISLAAGRNVRGIKKVNRFLTSVPYIFLICMLTVISNTLSAELIVYTVFAALAVYICLLGEDLLGLMPIVICCYLAPSVKNNPGSAAQTIFSPSGGGIYILCLGAVMAAALIVRLIADRPVSRAKRTLLPGMVLLGLGYVLSGIGSPAYPELALKNILFALLQFAAIVLPYLVFSVGIRWEKARKDYFAWIGFGVGCLLLCQILWIYISAEVVVNGVIDRSRIYTGWGIHNNIGGLLAMMIPFAFYLAAKYQRGWIGTVAGSAFLIGVLLTCSRSSILIGTCGWLVCIGMMFRTARNRRGNGVALTATVVTLTLTLLIFHKQLLLLFGDFLSLGLDPSSRDTIYLEGCRQFARYPIFGGSFYPIDFEPWDWATQSSFSSFFPPRWHNTVVQLLASCGIVGLGTYLWHRVQTVKLFVKNFNREKAFIGCSLLVLLVTSLFDCHFFNIGPVLFYAMGLAFAENSIRK